MERLGSCRRLCRCVTLGELPHVSVLQASHLSGGVCWYTPLTGPPRQHTGPGAILCSPYLHLLLHCVSWAGFFICQVFEQDHLRAHWDTGWWVTRQVAGL